MKKYLLIWVLANCDFAANAQVTFQKTYGGLGYDQGFKVQQTVDSGYFLLGRIESPGRGIDIFLIKTDSNGDTLWTSTIGGIDDDLSYAAQTTNDGGYIICGGTQSFGAGDHDVYLIKTDANGNVLWTKTFGGTYNDYGMSVQQTSDSGYVIGGCTYSFGIGFVDVYLIKTDVNGDSLWTKVLGGTGAQTCSSVLQTDNGEYILVGTSNSAVYLMRTDVNGNSIWAKTLGGTSTDYGESIQKTTDGGYIISGYTTSFGAGSADVYLIKIDSIGNPLWSKSFGGTGSEYGYSVRQTSDGGYIIAGSTLSFGAGSFDVYLIKVDSGGDSLWTRTFGGTLSEHGYDVQQTLDGGYILVALTSSFGVNDIYLVKTDSIGNSGCNQSNPATVVTTPSSVVIPSAVSITSAVTVVTTPVTSVGSGGIVTVLCTTVGVASISNSNTPISISPNPSTRHFQITYSLPQNLTGTLVITDVTGKTIYKKSLPAWSTMQSITLPDIAAGLYNCVITSEEKRMSGKMAVLDP